MYWIPKFRKNNHYFSINLLKFLVFIIILISLFRFNSFKRVNSKGSDNKFKEKLYSMIGALGLG